VEALPGLRGLASVVEGQVQGLSMGCTSRLRESPSRTVVACRHRTLTHSMRAFPCVYVCKRAHVGSLFNLKMQTRLEQWCVLSFSTSPLTAPLPHNIAALPLCRLAELRLYTPRCPDPVGVAGGRVGSGPCALCSPAQRGCPVRLGTGWL